MLPFLIIACAALSLGACNEKPNPTNTPTTTATTTAPTSASPADATESPAVKPIKLMEYLVRLVTPAGGTVLDPYMGSGTTLVAAAHLGFDSIGIDRDDDNEYLPIVRMRLASIADITEGDAP